MGKHSKKEKKEKKHKNDGALPTPLNGQITDNIVGKNNSISTNISLNFQTLIKDLLISPQMTIMRGTQTPINVDFSLKFTEVVIIPDLKIKWKNSYYTVSQIDALIKTEVGVGFREYLVNSRNSSVLFDYILANLQEITVTIPPTSLPNDVTKASMIFIISFISSANEISITLSLQGTAEIGTAGESFSVSDTFSLTLPEISSRILSNLGGGIIMNILQSNGTIQPIQPIQPVQPVHQPNLYPVNLNNNSAGAQAPCFYGPNGIECNHAGNNVSDHNCSIM